MARKLSMAEVRDFVEEHIVVFHQKRLDKLKNLKLSDVLKRKNPYLFKAKNILTAQDLIKSLLDAYLSSQEETIFGDFLESLAIFVNKRVYAGRKSSADGIDLDFEKDGVRYIVSVKSGPNWGNSSQIRKMREDFNKAKRILRTGGQKQEIVAINGCCYGRNRKTDFGDYFKYCGQSFWELISGDENLYLEIIEPLGHKAKQRNEEFQERYAEILNEFSLVFAYNFCVDGKIDWDALVKFSSAKEPSGTGLLRPPKRSQS